MLKMHPENRIGIKICSNADLGRSASSHQTHTGLSEGVFTFLGQSEVISNCIFIYNNKAERLQCLFDKILSNTGIYRSPKIRQGTNSNSVLARMREIANQTTNDLYLVYFALDDCTPVFIFIDKNSDLYGKFSENGFPLATIKHTTLSEQSSNYFRISSMLLTYIMDLQNDSRSRELEEFIQTGSSRKGSNRTFSPSEIANAKKNFAIVGRNGECHINAYLTSLKSQGEISDFKWNNQESESFLPFDFEITKANKKTYIEVKTTGFDFNQRMVFSRNEIEFAVQHLGNYHIYRVFKTEQNTFAFKKCSDTVEIISKIYEALEQQEEQIREIVDISFLNIAIDPSSLNFEDQESN